MAAALRDPCESAAAGFTEMYMASSGSANVRKNKKNASIRRVRAGSKRAGRDYYDYNLLAVVILLTCFGLVMLYSTSAYEATREFGTDTYYFGKQALISLGALVMVVVGSQIDYHFYVRWSDKLYYLSIALLVSTKFIGRTINGARRWIYIGPISFQPAELAKLAVILFLPFTITSMSKESMKGIKAPMLVIFFGGLSSFCTFYFTDNLSTAIIILGIAVTLAFIVHDKTKPFLYLFAAGLALILIVTVFVLPRLVESTDNFRINRILVWRHPEDYADKGGYQVMQALYAIGSSLSFNTSTTTLSFFLSL